MAAVQWDGGMAYTNYQAWFYYQFTYRVGILSCKKVLFGYCCGVQYSTKYSLYMVLMEQSLRLTTDNNFHGLCDVVDE
jgi:hypothetical protein